MSTNANLPDPKAPKAGGDADATRPEEKKNKHPIRDSKEKEDKQATRGSKKKRRTSTRHKTRTREGEARPKGGLGGEP